MERDKPGKPQDRDQTIAQPEADTPHPAEPRPSAALPTSVLVGPYTILEVLGEGGMGTVYLAEQTEPIRRKVALKIIKPGMDTQEVVARFESERQALALMNHPNIAAVHDAGSTDNGRPYFAMEYVNGIPITDYCDEHRLDVTQRLQVFHSVCLAIHHAHQRGIIHRDIKPKNVLVEFLDGNHVPKVIDFGIAKATNMSLGERSVFTEMGRLIGTPEYMSPEQAAGTQLDIDTTTDVYALGVLLYELLAGVLPINPMELREAGWAGIPKMILETEPKVPSARLVELSKRDNLEAECRRTTPAKLISLVRGELDWIVMRAIEKERARRYQSASEFAADITRYLAKEPVLARKPSSLYRMRKLVARHQLKFSFALLLLLLLVGFSISTTIQSQRIARQRDRANLATATAREVADFMIDMFEVSDPGQTRGESITAREILDKAVFRIETELGNQPLVRARMMATLGSVYTRLGLYDQARPLLESALATRRALVGDRDLEVAATLNSLANLLQRTGDYDRAEPLYAQAHDIRKALLGAGDPLVAASLNNLANLAWRRGRLDTARDLQEQALGICLDYYDQDHPDIARGLNNLAALLQQQGHPDEALPLLEQALAIYRKTLGPDHPDVAATLFNLATVLHLGGDTEQARPLYEEALAIREKTLGPDHPDVAASLENLAMLLEDTGDPEAAMPLYERAIAIRTAVLGDAHPDLAAGLNNLAVAYVHAGRLAEAEPLYLRALAIRRAALGPDHPDVAASLVNLGLLDKSRGRLAEARRRFEEAVGIRSRISPPDSDDLLVLYYDLARICSLQGETAPALAYFRQAVTAGFRRPDPDLDPELAALRDLPEFVSLIAPQ